MKPPDWKPGDRLRNFREGKYGFYKNWLAGEDRELVTVILDSTGDLIQDNKLCVIEKTWDRRDVEWLGRGGLRLVKGRYL